MPAWEDYKAEAKSRGALAHELFMALSTPTEGLDAVKENLPDHLAYIGSLESNGSLFMAGPVSDETGEEMDGTGMLILRASSFEEAHALVAGDPMHKSGARSFVLRRWLINEGSLSLSVGLSTRSVSLP